MLHARYNVSAMWSNGFEFAGSLVACTGQISGLGVCNPLPLPRLMENLRNINIQDAKS